MYRRAFVIALLCAGFAVGLFLLYLKKFEEESSGGPRVRVLVALRALERGKPLTEDALTVREIPQAYVEDRSIREIDKAKVLGLRLGGLVQAQQTLMWTDLGGSEEHPELSALVQPGRRALTLQFRDHGVGAMLRPGDYVDVIAVMPDSGGASAEARTARVLLQRVLVLAVGDSLSVEPADDKSPHGAGLGRLTLSVTLPEAQMLVLASERGVLSTALRGVDDNHTSERAPDVNVSAMLDPVAREQLAAARRSLPTELPRLGGDGAP